MSRLVHLNLSRCNLEGPIPIDSGNLKSLKVLHLAGSNAEGPIPSTIATLKQLKELRLHNNMLTDIMGFYTDTYEASPPSRNRNYQQQADESEDTTDLESWDKYWRAWKKEQELEKQQQRLKAQRQQEQRTFSFARDSEPQQEYSARSPKPVSSNTNKEDWFVDFVKNSIARVSGTSDSRVQNKAAVPPSESPREYYEPQSQPRPTSHHTHKDEDRFVNSVRNTIRSDPRTTDHHATKPTTDSPEREYDLSYLQEYHTHDNTPPTRPTRTNKDEDWFINVLRSDLPADTAASLYLNKAKSFLSEFTVAGQKEKQKKQWTGVIPDRVKRSSGKGGVFGDSTYYEPITSKMAWEQGPIFPGLKQSGYTVQGAATATFWIFAFGATVTLLYEAMNALKKSGNLAPTIDALERLTGLNLSWILYLYDVDPTQEYLQTASKIHKLPPVEVVADASGHPLKGRSLFADRWTSSSEKKNTHAQFYEKDPLVGHVPGPTASSSNFNPMGWRQHHPPPPPQTHVHEPVHQQPPSPSLIQSLISFQLPSIPPPPPLRPKPTPTDFTTKPKPRRTRPQTWLDFPLPERVYYPAKANPDYPHLAFFPTPICTMLDWNDYLWGTSQDAAAWALGVTVVKPVEAVAGTVHGGVKEVGEWVGWGRRYGTQTVRRALGYSKKPVVVLPERKVKPKIEVVSSKWFS
ncbi:hypothetical protein HDU98_005536 [Podochytrium sp. JEL0797]|nr:hypothetical protein HDU98_005536 [Podochytrium sp. JEL0797]